MPPLGYRKNASAPPTPSQMESVRILAKGGDRARLLRGELPVPATLTTSTFLALTEERLWWAFKALDPSVIAGAPAKDLSTIISMLIEKRNLLRGEPTQIVRSEQRVDLERAAKLLMREAAKRGVTLDGDFREVQSGEAAIQNAAIRNSAIQSIAGDTESEVRKSLSTDDPSNG